MLVRKYGRWEYNATLSIKDIPRTEFYPFIEKLREVNFLMTFFSLGLLWIILFTYVRNSLIPSITVLFVITQQFFLNGMLRVNADSHYIFFFLAAVLSYRWYLQMKKKEFLVIFAICLGLAVSAKLTGITIFFSYILYILIQCIEKKNLSLLKEYAVVSYIGFTIWFIVNPTLYFSPLNNSIKFFTIRQGVMKGLQRDNKQDALLTPQRKIQAVSCTLIANRCVKTSFVTLFFIPASFIFLIMRGIFLLATRRAEDTFILTVCIVSFFILTLTLYLDWDRYYVPLIVVVSIIEGIGIFGVFRSGKRLFLNRIQ
jgi:4-amino-4-deoxy-L-arabinose transferase-like glycosyltransferase